MNAKALAILSIAVGTLTAAPPALAQFTCSTVSANLLLDPNGDTLSNRFSAPVGVNASGDVLFAARPIGGADKLYLYPMAGGDEVVAAGLDAAPNGRAFRPGNPFASYSLNDAADLAFVGFFIGGGGGVFVRESGGMLETAAAAGDASPGGGFFTNVGTVSRVNSSAQIAFVGLNDGGGPDGVYRYDAVANTLTTLIETADLTTGGLEVCDFFAVGLGDSGEVAVRGTTKTLCSDGAEVPVETIFFTAGGFIEEAAAEGDASPISGTNYARFEQSVLMNASGQILFRATVAGVQTTSGLFLHDPGGPSTTTLVARFDAAPGGGAIGAIQGYALSDAGEAYFRSSLTAGGDRRAVLIGDGSLPFDTVLTLFTPPPTDEFQVGARFAQLGDPAVAGDGSWVALRADIRDTVAPRGRRAVLLCMP